MVKPFTRKIDQKIWACLMIKTTQKDSTQKIKKSKIDKISDNRGN